MKLWRNSNKWRKDSFEEKKRFLIFMLAENNDCFQCQRYYRHKRIWKNDYRNPWRPRLGVISCEQMRVPARGISPSYNGRKRVQPTSYRNKERVLILSLVLSVHLISTADKREYNFKHCPRCVETKQRWKVKFYPWTNSDS